MAISDQQIFDWFLANPNADDATIAATMDQFSLKPEDIARATGSNVADIQSRYTATQTPTGGIVDLISAPVDNVTSTGGYTKSATAPTSGGVSNVIEGDDIDTQIDQLPEQSAYWARSADQRSMELIDVNTGAVLDREAVGDFSDLDLLKTGLSFVPGAGQILAAVNIADAVNSGDLTKAAIGLTGLGGYTDLNTALRVGQAVDSGNTLGALTALAGNTNVQNALNLGDANVGGFTAKDTVAAANLVNAAETGNYGGVLTNLGTLTDSPDTALAGRAVTLITRLENGDTRALNDAISLSNIVSGGGSTGTTGSTTVGDFEDNEVTRLQGLGYTNQQIQDYFDTLDNLTGVFDDQSAVLTDTTTGGTADTANLVASGLDQDTADFLTSIGITSIDQLADSGLSNQDILDMVGAGDDELIVTDAKGTDTITGTDTTTGGGTDDVEELVVTDKKGTDTVTGIDTITGGDGNDLVVDDKGEVVIKDKKESCPIGTVLNPETGECDPVTEVDDKGEVVIKDKKESCPIGTVLNPETGECDPIEDKGEIVIKDKKESCPIGTVLNPETGECDPIVETPAALDCPEGYEPNEAGTACIPVVEIKDTKCDPGFVYDEDLKQCVAIKDEECPTGFHRDDVTGACVPDEVKKTLECPEGYEPNEAGTACIPVVVIKDKKCDPGFVYDEDLKQCVPIKGEEECLPGYHRDAVTGACVPDETKLECPEGYEPNEAGTACIPVVVIKDKKCDPGFVYDEDLKQCVPIEDEPCAEGFHLENGLCVPDGEECEDGYEKINGACVPVCKDGYIRNLATGVCEKVETKECPVGQVRNAQGKCVPIVTTPPQPPVITTPTTYVPSTGVSASGERIDPIYAEGMDAFDLFATLQELLAEEPKKKDSKKSKEKTKMATGGHLDDLLAEQMTVDDLLKLLR